jgi:hypothetical protein
MPEDRSSLTASTRQSSMFTNNGQVPFGTPASDEHGERQGYRVTLEPAA